MRNATVCDRNALAGEIMTHNPASINRFATLVEAAAFLSKKGIGAAPVIDEAGRPIGVLSCTDIVRYLKSCASNSPGARSVVVEKVMNPVVYFVRPHAPVSGIIDDLLKLGVHRLFVLDEHNVLFGVISTLDVLRHLRRKSMGEAHRPHPAPRAQEHTGFNVQVGCLGRRSSTR